MSGPLLAIFPHPDDETFSAGGLIAAARQRNVPVTLISATRGEAGESAISGLDPEQLGAVREQELRDAMAQLGLADVHFLDYRDSGMEGSTEAEHPRAFVRAPLEEVADRIAREIRALKPATVVTFGPEGVYGHPDHLHLHEAVVRAVEVAASSADLGDASIASWRTPALYFSTAPREEMLAIFDRPNSPLPSLSEKARANLGTPRADITHVLDVHPWEAQKLAAIRAHHTQTGEGGPLSGMPVEAFQDRLRREHFVRASLPWGRIEKTPDLLDLLISSQ